MYILMNLEHLLDVVSSNKTFPLKWFRGSCSALKLLMQHVALNYVCMNLQEDCGLKLYY